MLVLSRHKNEAVMVDGGSIRIVVVEIQGDRVRLGIEAPKDVDVHREEVFKAIQNNGRQFKEKGRSARGA